MNSPKSAYDHGLARRGKSLHSRLIGAANAHPFYLHGSLFGVATREPKAAIHVPAGVWRALDDDARATLKHYAASLVESMMADPLRFSQIPYDAPAAEALRRNSREMSSASWVIIEGRLKAEHERDPFDILTDQPVASGADDPLGA